MDILFIVKEANRGSIKPSKDYPGLFISNEWKIAEHRVKPGDRVGFTNSYNDETHTQGTVVNKVRLANGRYSIIFKPDNNSVDCKSVALKNRHTEKNYV